MYVKYYESHCIYATRENYVNVRMNVIRHAVIIVYILYKHKAHLFFCPAGVHEAL